MMNLQLDEEPPTAMVLFLSGGLTFGLEISEFNDVAAVEHAPHSLATFESNHSEVEAFQRDVRGFCGHRLKDLSFVGRIACLLNVRNARPSPASRRNTTLRIPSTLT